MSKYATGDRKRRRVSRVWLAGGGLVVLLLVALFMGYQAYSMNLAPVSRDQRTEVVVVLPGSGVKQIANDLAAKHIIKSSWALELYVYTHKDLAKKFQAGSYALSPSSTTRDIVATLTRGDVTTRLVTILPGRRIDQVRADLINDGFTPESVDKALLPDQYAGMAALAFKPSNVNSLEGLLWPDSFQKDASTDPSQIIRQSLDETASHLTPAVLAELQAQGLTPYQGIILASIVEQEVANPKDRAQAAQVFLSRLRSDISLGSDPTAKYGSIIAGKPVSLTYDSPYNTLLNKGLPPTPISTISAGVLEAVSQPAKTDWLFFVAGDDGTTHFSKTLEEHQALTDKYCHKLCGR